MRDIISKGRVDILHPERREEVRRIITNAETKFPKNIAIRVVQGLRTFAEQDALFAKRPKVTKAKGGQSLHNYGLAIDFALLYDKDNNGTYEELSWDVVKDFDKDNVADWQEVVSSFEAAGWEWGGKWRTFKDLPHCQKTDGYTWQQLLAKYNSGDTFTETINGKTYKYVNI